MATWSPVIIIIKIYKNVKNCQKMPKTGKIILNFFIIFFHFSVSETIPKNGTSRFHTMFGSKNVKKCPKPAKKGKIMLNFFFSILIFETIPKNVITQKIDILRVKQWFYQVRLFFCHFLAKLKKNPQNVFFANSPKKTF